MRVLLKSRHFYPRPPCGGRRFHQCNRSAAGRISIHALRVEGDNQHFADTVYKGDFYPRPPGGGRQGDANYYEYSPEISIHALRVEGDMRDHHASLRRGISIHALRVEGDQSDFECRRRLGISIHALRVEGDVILRHDRNKAFAFLSTPSGWRAT